MVGIPSKDRGSQGGEMREGEGVSSLQVVVVVVGGGEVSMGNVEKNSSEWTQSSSSFSSSSSAFDWPYVVRSVARKMP